MEWKRRLQALQSANDEETYGMAQVTPGTANRETHGMAEVLQVLLTLNSEELIKWQKRLQAPQMMDKHPPFVVSGLATAIPCVPLFAVSAVASSIPCVSPSFVVPGIASATP